MPPIPLDYETLRIVWWALMGVLLIGFAVMDGFDLGTGALLPYVARTDIERRVAINSIGPVWEGNQVWLITAGGALFAAWPQVYAAAFSGFYIAMFLVLVTLILRPVGFDFRHKIEHLAWTRVWDGALFLAGVVPPIVFGVAFGNLLQGVPLGISDELRLSWQGGFIDLLNPFGLLCGVLSLAMLVMHGAMYLQLKTAEGVAVRARRAAMVAAPVTIGLFAVGGIWVAGGIDGFVLAEGAVRAGPSNPLAKTVTREAGAWLTNFGANPWMWAAPALGFLGAAGAFLATLANRPGAGFVASGLAVAGVIGTAGLALFPFIVPSSLVPDASLTVWDASSSRGTLFIMLIVTAVFLPLVAAYTTWVYRMLRGTITPDYVTDRSNDLY